jgi:hypothetical protein
MTTFFAIALFFFISTFITGLFILRLLSSSKKLNRADKQKILKLQEEALSLRERVILLENNLNKICSNQHQEKSS